MTDTPSSNGAEGRDDVGDHEPPPLRTSRSRARIAEWSLVLEAAGIPFERSLGPDGWELRAEDRYRPRAEQTLDAYDQETVPEKRPADRARIEPYGRSWIGFVAAVTLTLFFGFSGPGEMESRWSRFGSSAAERILLGEVWRAFTALTLHVDLGHLLGNALGCLVFITLLGNQLGPGLAIWVTLVAGGLGNLLTAVVTRDHHVSIGASTATFGALGGLVGLRMAPPRRSLSEQPGWLALAAAAALFGMLGTGTGADVLAHFFGLLFGAALGAALVLGGVRLRSRWRQALLAIAAGGAVALCWALAFTRGKPL